MLLKNYDSRKLTMLLLTGVRVVLGIFWLLQITWKWPPDFGCPNEGLCKWLDLEIKYPLIPIYGEIVRTVMRPNVQLLGWFTTFVEEGIGLLLVLGLFTRFSSAVAAAWSVNLMIGLLNIPGEAGWYYAFLLMLNLVFVALGASGQLSIDRMRNLRTWWARTTDLAS